MESLLTMQTANQSIGLLGDTVQIQTEQGGQVGKVTTVTFEQGLPKLTVQLSNGAFLSGVSLSQVSLVRESAPEPTTNTAEEF